MAEPNPEPTTDRAVIVLADISGCTDFMLANRLTLVHGQQLITSLIEARIASSSNGSRPCARAAPVRTPTL